MDFSGQLALHAGTGAALFYGTQKVLKEVEDKLKPPVRAEIADWLRSIHTAGRISNWPSTCAALFDKVFGEDHLSFQCFGRSCLASLLLFTVSFGIFLAHATMSQMEKASVAIWALATAALSNLLPDYISLLKTRLVLRAMSLSARPPMWTALLVMDLVITGLFSALCVYMTVGMAFGIPIRHSFVSALYQLVNDTRGIWLASFHDKFFRFFCLPAFFGSLWVLLYAGAGYILQTAYHLDKSIAWLDKVLDIDNKPLQCIGLVAGSLSALGYWTVVITLVYRRLGHL